jgi:hypothetical protein
MKRKIEISSLERTMIIAALVHDGAPGLASAIQARFEHADSADDGPEIDILRVQVQS